MVQYVCIELWLTEHGSSDKAVLASISVQCCVCVRRSCAVFPAANEKAVTLYVVRCLHAESGFTASERILSCTASALQLANWSEH